MNDVSVGISLLAGLNANGDGFGSFQLPAWRLVQ